MRQWIFITIVLLLSAAPLRPTRGQAQCNNAIDYVVQAREQARPGLSPQRLEKMKVLLDNATRYCADYGDAWYYRALYARELRQPKDAKIYLSKAEQYGSEAWRQRDDPFAPAAPLPASAPTTTTANAPVKPDSAVSAAPAAQPPAATNAPAVTGVPTAPGASAAKPPAFRPVREKWAVVVGISKFLYNKKIIINNTERDSMNLRYTAKDATDFQRLLTDPKYGRFEPSNVKLLTDTAATVTGIKAAVGWLMDKAQPDDLVVFYISTHGSPRANGQNEINYIVAHDTDPREDGAGLYATSLPMVELVDDLRYRIKAQRVVLFLDTCFSGASATRAGTWAGGEGAKELGTVGMGVSSETLSRVDRDLGRVIVAASKDNELSWESERFPNSLFTYYLIQALKQDNGQAPIEQVFSSLSGEVARQLRVEPKYYKGVLQTQTPVMNGNTLNGQLDIRIGIAPQAH